jgi:hypothetical protein
LQTASVRPRHLVGILPILEAQHGIVGETYLVCCPLQAGLHFVLEPFIEHVVQVPYGQGPAKPMYPDIHLKPYYNDPNDSYFVQLAKGKL